jgi:hypothetical protein
MGCRLFAFRTTPPDAPATLVRFSSPKACSRPNWRRKPLCHFRGDRSAGACVRESLGSLFGVVVEFRLRRVDLIELHLAQELRSGGQPISPAQLATCHRRTCYRGWARHRTYLAKQDALNDILGSNIKPDKVAGAPRLRPRTPTAFLSAIFASA